jgi:hypothetical protein
MIYTVFWPIALFFVLNSFTQIGFLNSISFLLSSFVVLYIGRAIDKHGEFKIHAIGTVINTLLYVPRIFFSGRWLFYALDVTDRFVSGTYALPNMTASYEKARKMDPSDFELYREMMIHSGVVVVMAFALIAIQITLTWKWVFALAMIGSLMSFFIELDKN